MTAPHVNTPATIPIVGKPNMIMRSFRVPAALWAEFKAKADELDMNVSDVLRDLIAEWLERHR